MEDAVCLCLSEDEGQVSRVLVRDQFLGIVTRRR